MDVASVVSCTAFVGTRCVAAGELRAVATAVKQLHDQEGQVSVLIFDDVTSELVEIDYRGSLQAVLARLPTPSAPVAAEEAAARAPGRPKLGVVPREVTLLPRHWEWLAAQPGGASVALRKLVEAASRANEIKDRVRRAQEAAYRFMAAMAGDQPGFEEAVRALFADMPEQFGAQTEAWPADVRDHARMLALRVFGVPEVVA
jgi:hypothetical protein